MTCFNNKDFWETFLRWFFIEMRSDDTNLAKIEYSVKWMSDNITT